MDRCIEACKYFHENSLAGSHLAKALQVSLAGHETFQYDEQKLKEAYSYDGEPKFYQDGVKNDEDFEYRTNKKKFKRKVFGNITRFINTDGELEMKSSNVPMLDITLGRAGNV